MTATFGGSDIINEASEANGFPQNKFVEIIETLIALIKTKLVSGRYVLNGFEKLSVKNHWEKHGRILGRAKRSVFRRCDGKL
jgi:hypothetical protein